MAPLLGRLPRLWSALLRCLLLITLAQVVAAEKKSKFLANYPTIVKFFMFWWTILVFIVMGVFIADQLLTKRWGPARADWSIEYTFRSTRDRRAYWGQLVDPTMWSPNHPVLQSADVRVVKVEVEDSENVKVSPLALGPLKPGLGLMLRHKADSGPRAGAFFCTRLCDKLTTPEDEVWTFLTRTIESGEGYPLLPGTEETLLELWPPTAEGSLRCRMTSKAQVSSRLFCWWTKLIESSTGSAQAMLEAIEREVESAKKKD